jgi:hypothetical protein
VSGASRSLHALDDLALRSCSRFPAWRRTLRAGTTSWFGSQISTVACKISFPVTYSGIFREWSANASLAGLRRHVTYTPTKQIREQRKIEEFLYCTVHFNVRGLPGKYRDCFAMCGGDARSTRSIRGRTDNSQGGYSADWRQSKRYPYQLSGITEVFKCSQATFTYWAEARKERQRCLVTQVLL